MEGEQTNFCPESESFPGPPQKLLCRRTRSSIPRTDLKKCIICQAEKRQKRNRRLLERLARCEGDTTPATLCYAAQVRQDERVLLEIDQQDLWAKDIQYHASCYASYVSQRALEQLLKKDVAEEDAEDSAGAKQRAFASFAMYVAEHVINSETVTNMIDLCCLFVEFLRKEGIDVSSYRTCLLKARLKEHFGDVLTFHRPRKRTVTEYVFSSHISAGPLVEKCDLAMTAAEHAAEESFTMDDIVQPTEQHSAPAVDLFNAAKVFAI